jgi:hypothetical protein
MLGEMFANIKSSKKCKFIKKKCNVMYLAQKWANNSVLANYSSSPTNLLPTIAESLFAYLCFL